MIKSGFSLSDLTTMDQERRRMLLADALMGSATAPRQIANPMQGLAQMGEALVAGNQVRNSAFPTAPGGAAPSFATNLKNMLTRGNNGGLY